MATNYVYNQNIPFETNTPAQDQPNMKTNTNSTYSIVGTDHLTFGSATGSLSDGMHTVAHLVSQSGVVPAKVVGAGMIFTNPATFNAKTDEALFFQSSELSGTTNIQITAPKAYNGAANGYTFLPGGMILQWGVINSLGGGGVTTPLLFATANIDFPNNCFSVFTTLINAGGTNNTQNVSIRSGSVSNTGFSWNYTSGSSAYNGFYWIAIGN